MWMARRVIYLSQLIAGGAVKTFQALKEEFDLPNHMFFRYLQVRHALQSQFSASIPILESGTLVDVILGEDPKKLISILYNQLLLPLATAHAYQLKSKWEADLGGWKMKNGGKY